MVYKTSKETQERKDIKKKNIICTATKVFAARGYHNTTVKDVVEAADISVGTFYFYFKNKEDLFEKLYDEVTDELYEMLCNSLGNINNEIDTGFSKAIAFFLGAIEANQPLTKIMLIESVGLNPEFEAIRASVTSKFTNYAAGYFEKLKENSMISIPDVQISATAFIGTIYNVIMEWLQSGTKRKLTDYSYALTIYNLQALRIDYDEDKVRQGISEIMNRKF